MTIFQEGHALLIGVGGDLPGTVEDARGIADVLTDAVRCAYPPEQVRLLAGADATRANILAALDALIQSASPQSTILFYFSGHGCRAESPTGEAYYLIPQGYDLQKLYKTAVSGAELAERLRALAAQKVLVLLDCCHAGGVGQAKAVGVELAKAPLPGEALALLEEGRGVVLVASSQEDELSYAGRPYSAFTLALLEALSGVGVAKKDGWVRVADLALHAREVVPERTRGKQHPILHFEHADNFAVAYYAGGETEPKGLPFDEGAVEIEPQPGAWRGQQMNVAPVLSGTFHGAVTVEGGRQIDQGGAEVAFAGDVSGGEVHIGDRVTVSSTGERSIVFGSVSGGEVNIDEGGAALDRRAGGGSGERRCLHCGAPLRTGARFCSQCGRPVTEG